MRKIVTREIKTGTPGIRSIVTLECGHVIDVYNPPAYGDLDQRLRYAWDGVQRTWGPVAQSGGGGDG